LVLGLLKPGQWKKLLLVAQQVLDDAAVASLQSPSTSPFKAPQPPQQTIRSATDTGTAPQPQISGDALNGEWQQVLTPLGLDLNTILTHQNLTFITNVMNQMVDDGRNDLLDRTLTACELHKLNFPWGHTRKLQLAIM